MTTATTVEHPLPELPKGLSWEVEFFRSYVDPSGYGVIVRLRQQVGDRQFKTLAFEQDVLWLTSTPKGVVVRVVTLAKKVWAQFTAPDRESAQLYAFAEAVRQYTGAEVLGP